MTTIAIALLTWRNSIRQGLTWLVMLASVVLLGLSYVFGMFNFDKDDRLRLIASAGLAVITMHGLFLAAVLASSAVHDELSSRTAQTLFAKPVGRGGFLVGKLLGIFSTVCCSLLPIIGLHALLLQLISQYGFFGSYHLHRHVLDLPWWPVGAGYLLALANALLFTSLATVLAVRLPIAANILVCAAVFVLAHLLAAGGTHGMVLIPALGLFNVDDWVHFLDQPLAPDYVMRSIAYAVLYSLGSLLIGLGWFTRRDLP